MRRPPGFAAPNAKRFSRSADQRPSRPRWCRNHPPVERAAGIGSRPPSPSKSSVVRRFGRRPASGIGHQLRFPPIAGLTVERLGADSTHLRHAGRQRGRRAFTGRRPGRRVDARWRRPRGQRWQCGTGCGTFRSEPHRATAQQARRRLSSDRSPLRRLRSQVRRPRRYATVVDSQEIIRRLKDASVYIKLSLGGRPIGTGSGFVIEVRGDTVVVATNRHVAVPDLTGLPPSIAKKGDALLIEAVFHSGLGPREEQVLPAEIIAADLSDDIAATWRFWLSKV